MHRARVYAIHPYTTYTILESMVMLNIEQLTPMPNVLWLGGSPCAGKTTIARMLAEKYGLRLYHFDRHEPDHIEQSRAACISMLCLKTRTCVPLV
jgi:replication-associated recombination protein RarA